MPPPPNTRYPERSAPLPAPPPLASTAPVDNRSFKSFYIMATASFLLAALGLGWSFAEQSLKAEASIRVTVLILSGLAFLASIVVFILPELSRNQTQPLIDLPVVLGELKKQIADVDAIRLEHQRARSQFDANWRKLDEYAAKLDDFSNALGQFLNLKFAELEGRHKSLDERQRAYEELMRKWAETEKKLSDNRQEVERANDKSKKWQQAVIEFAGVLERILSPDAELTPEYRKAAQYLVGQIRKIFPRLGLQLIEVESGAAFDPHAHIIEGREPSDVDAGRVVRCTEWGVIFGEEVASKAKVILSSGRPATFVSPPPSRPAPILPTPSPLVGEEKSTVDPHPQTIPIPPHRNPLRAPQKPPVKPGPDPGTD